jgi:nitrate reductase molybdenum cofactor assembly chaperone
MTDHPPESLHVLSVLLHYPDEELFNRLDEVASAADQLGSAEIESAIRAFINALNTQSLIQIQERYTAVFDIDPATTLNMTYHAFGDNEKRAAALAHLQHHYEQAGWERITGELPDYLPMMLEFLSICACIRSMPNRSGSACRACSRWLPVLKKRHRSMRPFCNRSSVWPPNAVHRSTTATIRHQKMHSP